MALLLRRAGRAQISLTYTNNGSLYSKNRFLVPLAMSAWDFKVSFYVFSRSTKISCAHPDLYKKNTCIYNRHEVIKFFHAQLIYHAHNVKMPTIVGILTFISMINTTS